jgi:hypothetical protein
MLCCGGDATTGVVLWEGCSSWSYVNILFYCCDAEKNAADGAIIIGKDL